MVLHPKSSALWDKAALALGHITMEWARIEGVLHELMRVLGRLEGGKVEDIFYGNTDQRSKTQIVLALAHHRNIDDDWFSELNFVLNYIDNSLRVRRNAVTHAEWFMPKRGLVRQVYKTKIVRPQSYKTELQTQQNIPVSIKELKQISDDMRVCWFAMLSLLFYLYDESGDLRRDTSQGISFRLYLRAVGLDHHLRRLHRRRQPQPRPSLPLIRQARHDRQREQDQSGGSD